VAALRERMLDWYAANKRDLPWRRVADAYALVTVELMSQQTGVERIAPRWQRFVERFPSWEAVAGAPLGDVIREWQGLGYNRRAVSLHRMATAVVERYGGELPADRAELLKLPGVGPYTANAILSFVHGHDVAAIDVNLRRVIGRVAFGDAAAADADVLSVAQEALPPGRSGDWNQALMDFASLVCTLRRPLCLLCPLRDVCRYANEAGEEPAQVVAYPLREDAPRRRAAERRAPFVGSTRYYRGRIVEALRGLPAGQTASLEEIVQQIGAPEGSVDPAALVAGLVRDGLVHEHEVGGHQRFSLP
jgi:A/G-specific adenine glycosylase